MPDPRKTRNLDETKPKRRAGDKASLIYERLRTDILNGKLAPGTPLSQLAIAKARGISRGPVREAMRRLQQDQLIIGRTNQRFNVAPYDISDLESVLCLHLANIALAMRVGVPLLTDAEVEELRRSVDLMESTVGHDVAGWEAAYRDFTFGILKHTGARTISLAGVLLDNIQRYRMNLLNKVPRVWHAGGLEFREIFDAVRARDGQLASTRYAEFFGRTSSLILAGASPRYDAFRLRGYISALTLPDSH